MPARAGKGEIMKQEASPFCAACGMHIGTMREYHPWAICTLFRFTNDSRTVRANIRAVVGYGMKAERAGVSLDDAMADIKAVLDSGSQHARAAAPERSEAK